MSIINKVFAQHRSGFSLLLQKFGRWIPDKPYLQMMFYIQMGKRLNLKNPHTFSEKLQWMKLYNRKPEYSMMVDKYAVKDHVAGIIGREYIIPTLGVWNRPEDIDWDSLPHQFVLKTTNGGGSKGVVICKEKDSFDRKKAVMELNQAFHRNIYKKFREWPYKDIQARIIAEQYMEDNATKELRDYKFFCFDGKVKALFIASDRMANGEETKFDFFDENYHHLPLTNGHPNADVLPTKPVCFEKMKELSAKLSAGIPHVRVDFYEVNGKVYFGELTFFHWSGMKPFVPENWDTQFGEWIHLPNSHSCSNT